jgi:hypothetical protein
MESGRLASGDAVIFTEEKPLTAKTAEDFAKVAKKRNARLDNTRCAPGFGMR